MDIKELLLEIDRPVKLSRILRKLELSEDDLEKEAREQPGLYLEASRFRTQTMWKRQVRLQKYEVLRAEKSLQYRSDKFKKSRSERVTEKEIEHRVLLEPKMRKAKFRLEQAFKLEEWAKALTEAYKQRQQVIKTISDIRNAEIANEIRNVKEGMARDTMRMVSEKARRRLREREDDE